ncbi:MAG: hypothetical protein MHM6MM_003549, partial [Cercozoa sp. M6MM]
SNLKGAKGFFASLRQHVSDAFDLSDELDDHSDHTDHTDHTTSYRDQYHRYDELYLRLRVSPSASVQEIRSRFHALALQYHPDVHVNSSSAQRAAASERFKSVLEAYRVLRNPAKRARYDRTGLY